MTGLTISAFDSDIALSLLIGYTRNIMPVNRDHIPTPEMALQWPQLENIA